MISQQNNEPGTYGAATYTSDHSNKVWPQTKSHAEFAVNIAKGLDKTP